MIRGGEFELAEYLIFPTPMTYYLRTKKEHKRKTSGAMLRSGIFDDLVHIIVSSYTDVDESLAQTLLVYCF